MHITVNKNMNKNTFYKIYSSDITHKIMECHFSMVMHSFYLQKMKMCFKVRLHTVTVNHLQFIYIYNLMLYDKAVIRI